MGGRASVRLLEVCSRKTTPPDFSYKPSELAEWRFVKAEDLDAYVTPVMARRLRASLASTDFVYLEEGYPE